MTLKNKVVIITGSSRGIGRATAIEFAKEGAKVVVNYVKSEREAKRVVKEIKKLGSEAIAVKADVSNRKQVKKLVEITIKKFKKIDILVNNVGGGTFAKTLSKSTEDDWIKTYQSNVLSAFFCSQTVTPYMLKQKYGKIINISSIRGLEHCGRTLEYGAAKAAIINFTKTLAKQLVPFINVNSVAPGWVDTDSTRNISSKLRKIETQKIYMRRFAKPEEIAHAVVFLASDKASYITGHILVVDGGYSLK